MTAEYLDRSSLVARMKYYEKHTTEESGEHYAYSVALREIRNAPAADVVEVVHAKWIPFHSEAAGDIQLRRTEGRMNTHITNIKGNWQEVVDTCRATSGKGSLGHEPSEDFKRRILIAEHSPIRRISVSWVWKGIKSWIATHWSRHKWECFISTQRTDRTGTPRDKLPQDAPVVFEGEANVQALIDSMRKRLCSQADPETRAYAEDFKAALYEIQPEISDVLVPNCVYRCGCPEMQTCGMYEWWLKFHPDIASTDIQKRYNTYNELFWKVRAKRGNDSGD